VSSKRKKSVLAQASEIPNREGAESSFWWRDPDRLLARVMSLAKSDPKVRRLLRAKVGKLARHDEEFRLELRKDLDAIGEGKKGRPSSYGPLYGEYVLGFVEWLKANGHAKTNPDAFDEMAAIERQRFPDITDDAVRGIYQRARYARKKHETP